MSGAIRRFYKEFGACAGKEEKMSDMNTAETPIYDIPESYVLCGCSTADMPESFFVSRRIPCAFFHFTLDGKSYDDNFGKSIPFDKFYKMIADGKQPVSSQVNVAQYIDLWTPYLEMGKDILHVALSSGISGTYNSACMARDEVSEKYPGRRIIVVDSLGASSGFGLLLKYMANRRDEGMSLDELHQWALDNRLHVHHWFFSTDLTSYWRGGRISRASAFFGNAFNICPLMNVNCEGKLIPRRNVRTKRKVIDEIVKEMMAHVQGGANYSGLCEISNSACLKDAEAVAAKIVEQIPQLEGRIGINSIGTTIGTHTGPGTVALFFMGDERGL